MRLSASHTAVLRVGLVLVGMGLVLIGCAGPAAPSESADHIEEHETEAEVLVLPDLQPVELGDRPLNVVTTTSIIGDVVEQVGGDAIELSGLMGPGQDPHSYEPAARDLTTVAQADVIFINGWDLEEGLVHELEEIGEDALLVPISAKISPLTFSDHHSAEGEQAEHEHEHEGEEAEHEHDHHHLGADPHVWFDIENVRQWTRNVEQVLSELDPDNAETYRANAETYLGELAELEEYTESQLAALPESSRFLVTNHDSFSYFAERYGFEVLGTVLPAASTLAEPSASELSALIQLMEEHQVCAIFTETTVSDTLAKTVAAELEGCDEVKVVQLYTGAVGPPGSGAESYLGMFKTNVDAIVEGLK
jgi:ABC-type Zn uptake system ZnuABC Zn-binding protein ZnuA